MATFQASPTPAGLVAGYGFNEGTGTTVTDSSGSSNTGTIQGGTTWSAAGRFGGALTFNGSSGRVSVPDTASLDLTSAVTLEAWVNPAANQTNWRTVVQKQVDSYLLHASNSSGALRPAAGVMVGTAVPTVVASSAIPVNTWSHLAMTYDGAQLRLYVNGALISSRDQTGPIATSTSPLWIGGNSPYGEYFNGRIDEVRVYNRALTARRSRPT